MISNRFEQFSYAVVIVETYNGFMTIETSIRIWNEGDHYIAHAMPLDVSSAGVSPDAARSALREAIALFVSTAHDVGTLRDVLQDCGYDVYPV